MHRINLGRAPNLSLRGLAGVPLQAKPLRTPAALGSLPAISPFSVIGTSALQPQALEVSEIALTEFIQSNSIDFTGSFNMGKYFSDTAEFLYGPKPQVTEAVLNFSLKDINEQYGHKAGDQLLTFVFEGIRDLASSQGLDVSIYRDGPNYTIRVNNSSNKQLIQQFMSSLKTHFKQVKSINLINRRGEDVTHLFARGIDVNVAGYSYLTARSASESQLGVIDVRMFNRYIVDQVNSGNSNFELQMVDPLHARSLDVSNRLEKAIDRTRAIDSWRGEWLSLKKEVQEELLSEGVTFDQNYIERETWDRFFRDFEGHMLRVQSNLRSRGYVLDIYKPQDRATLQVLTSYKYLGEWGILLAQVQNDLRKEGILLDMTIPDDRSRIEKITRQKYIEPDSGLLNRAAFEIIGEQLITLSRAFDSSMTIGFFDGNKFGSFTKVSKSGGYSFLGGQMVDIIIQKRVVNAARKAFGNRGIVFFRCGTGSEEFILLGDVSEAVMAEAMEDFQLKLAEPIRIKATVRELRQTNNGRSILVDLHNKGYLRGKLGNLDHTAVIDISQIPRGPLKEFKGLTITGAYAPLIDDKSKPAMQVAVENYEKVDAVVDDAKAANPSRVGYVAYLDANGNILGNTGWDALTREIHKLRSQAAMIGAEVKANGHDLLIINNDGKAIGHYRIQGDVIISKTPMQKPRG